MHPSSEGELGREKQGQQNPKRSGSDAFGWGGPVPQGTAGAPCPRQAPQRGHSADPRWRRPWSLSHLLGHPASVLGNCTRLPKGRPVLISPEVTWPHPECPFCSRAGLCLRLASCALTRSPSGHFCISLSSREKPGCSVHTFPKDLS